MGSASCDLGCFCVRMRPRGSPFRALVWLDPGVGASCLPLPDDLSVSGRGALCCLPSPGGVPVPGASELRMASGAGGGAPSSLTAPITLCTAFLQLLQQITNLGLKTTKRFHGRALPAPSSFWGLQVSLAVASSLRSLPPSRGLSLCLSLSSIL